MSWRSVVAVAVVLFAGSAWAADDLKSGPQVGEGVSGGFYPHWVNGDFAGGEACPV